MALRRADHDLAAAAMAALADIRDGEDKGNVPDQVLTRIAGLPTMLRTSGVLPTLAFYAAKGSGSDGGALTRAYEKVGVALRAQVCAALNMDSGPDRPAVDVAFLTELTRRFREEPHTLSRVSVRLEQFSMWMRRLAEALAHEQERAKQVEKAQNPAAEAPRA